MVGKKLRNAAKGVFSGEEEIDRILAMPITGLRMELKKAFRKKHFPQEEYEDFIKRLSGLDGEKLDKQIKLVESAIENRKVDSPMDIDLSSPAKQLLWAAALTRMMQTGQGQGPITESPLWKQLRSTTGARDEMIRSSRVVYASLKNNDTSLSWGHPGSWFFYNPEKNHINLDLYYSLLTGFEHIRSVNLHEIGHSELSNKYSPRMEELHNKLKPYLHPVTGQLQLPKKMTVEDQKELALVAKEWELRHRFYNCFEDICVNQFAANMEQRYPQDFGYSLNHISAMLQGFGEKATGDTGIEALGEEELEKLRSAERELEKKRKEAEKELGGLNKDEKAIFNEINSRIEEEKKKVEDQGKKMQARVELESRALTDKEIGQIKKGDVSPELAQKMYDQISWGGLLAFYKHNGLVSGKKETWERLWVFPDDISGTVDVSGVPEAKGKDPFEYLVELSAGKNGIHTLQPQPQDRMFGKARYHKAVEDTTDARLAVMDHIWDVYIDKFAQVLMKDFEDKVDQEIQNKQDQGKENDKGEESDKGKPQPGDGQNPGEKGEPGEQGKGKGSQPSSSGQGGESGKGEPQASSGNEEKPLSEQLKDMLNDMKESPEDQRKSDQEGAGNENDDKDGNDASGDKEAPGGDGWEQDPSADQDSDDQKVGDLRQKDIVEDMSDEQKEAQKQAVKEMDKPGKDALSMDAGKSREIDLAALAKGDWKDFNRRVLELAPVINAVADSLKKIRAEQKRQIMKQSKDLDFMAEDGDIMGRLDRDKVLETKYKQAAREKMDQDDLKRFQEDAIHINESTIEFFQAIDGSGSMPGLVLTGETTAMEAALQSAVIMYMACRKAGVDGYIIMWGNDPPMVVARPDSNLNEVGVLLETLRDGTHSGTSLAPALNTSIQELSVHRNKNGTISGSSHIQVYSDGDIADAAEAERLLEIIAGHSKNLTVDVAVLRPPEQDSETAMERVVNGVIAKKNSRMIGLMRGHDANDVPRVLAMTILARVRKIHIKTEPDSVKRRRLKSLHRKMQP